MSKYAAKLGVTRFDEGTRRPAIKLGVSVKLGVSGRPVGPSSSR